MKIQSKAKLSIASLAILGTAAIAGYTPSALAGNTVFECVAQGANWATVGKRNGKVSTPLIVWTTTLSSDSSEGSYTPDRRCQAVSTRLTNLTSALGNGSFSNLWLDYGTANNQVAICVYNGSQIGCNERNVVFTLKPENRPYADDILRQLQNFSKTGSGSPIFESSDDSDVIPSRAVSLEAWEKQAFGSESVPASGSSEPEAAPAETPPANNPSGGSIF